MATVLNPPEQRIMPRNVSWETYELLLADHTDSSSPRFTYDKGALEIMSPSPEHERVNRSISMFVEVLAEVTNLDWDNLGSTTFKREDLERGFEPDSCFYIQNAEFIKGKTKIDLHTDPPPDLIIEIDITSESLNKLPIYAQLRIPEVWRYDGKRLIILRLEGNEFIECERSFAFPFLADSVISTFIENSKSLKRAEWLRSIREWAQLNKQA